jgi:uncharacterized membrane protein YqaE (UPF0057 family)
LQQQDIAGGLFFYAASRLNNYLLKLLLQTQILSTFAHTIFIYSLILASVFMKKHFLLLCFAVCSTLTAFAFESANIAASPVKASQAAPEISAWSPEMANISTERFLNLTPKEYKKLTGKKLGIKGAVALKMAQHKIKQNYRAMQDGNGEKSDLDKSTYIILAIFIPFLAVGLATDWEGNDWIIALLLNVLTCWLGGFIYALVKMKNYYPA